MRSNREESGRLCLVLDSSKKNVKRKLDLKQFSPIKNDNVVAGKKIHLPRLKTKKPLQMGNHSISQHGWIIIVLVSNKSVTMKIKEKR